MEKNIYFESNYVLLEGTCTQLEKEHLDLIESGNYLELEPIKITQDWLYNFGFKHDSSKYVYNHSENEWVEVLMIKEKVKRIDFMFNENHTFFNVDIDHVHTLQNLYKQRFDEELILKQVF